MAPLAIRHRLVRVATAAYVGLLAACASAPPETPATAPLGPLAGTTWQLVEFQSSSDEIGTLRPDDPSLYTMQLLEDGTVAMRLSCNRAFGTWSAALAGGDAGGFEFGPLVVTRAACPPPSMDERIARDAQYVRSYVLENGRLYLSLMADGGIYAWEPAP